MKVRIAAIQLKPKFGDVAYNTLRASDIVSKLYKQDLPGPDILVLPELVFTGYNFKSPTHITPFLENFHAGVTKRLFFECPSIKWAIETSKTYQCFTVVGYPELFKDTIYNSSCLVSPIGSILFNYRKSFLYKTDKVWGAKENPVGFENFQLNLNKEYYREREDLSKKFGVDESVFPRVHDQGKVLEPLVKNDGIVVEKISRVIHKKTDFDIAVENLDDKYSETSIKTAMGICMDLSNYEFKASFEKFEFSRYCLDNDVRLILFPMAWLSSVSPEITYEKKNDDVGKEKDTKFLQDQLDSMTKEVELTTNIKDDDGKVMVNDSCDVNSALKRVDIRDIANYDKNAIDSSNVNFWILRGVPLYNSFYKMNAKIPDNNKIRYIVLCNRTGMEDGVVYCGSTSIVKYTSESPVTLYEASQKESADVKKIQKTFQNFQELDNRNPSVEILGSLPTGREAVLIRDIEF